MTPDRRQLFHAAAALGVGSATFHRATAAVAADTTTVTPDMVKDAEWVAGITLTDAERKTVADGLTRYARNFAALRKITTPNALPPAIQFNPVPGAPPSAESRGTVTAPDSDIPRPASDEDLAFLPLAKLAHLLKSRKVSSVELTKLYLARLKQYDPALLCVVTLTEELALQQAEAADRDIAAGKYRGPLHGIPWGAKDLIAVPGYPTTWGAERYKEQRFDTPATVASKLTDAGAVLVAKLTLGTLALGDQWFGGMTRNPWHVREGSSGSSAGSGSAVAAGLVGFAVGSETYGSIVSPSTRCGVTGLRPTFGRVARTGCMALTWTMDKLGPMARSAEDCALILGAIHGHDGLDPTAVDRPFAWPGPTDLTRLRVGVYAGKDLLHDADRKTLASLGVQLVDITAAIDALHAKLPITSRLTVILDAEAAALFDELPRAGIRDGFGRYWGNTFRRGQFVTAIEYLRANRLRTLLMREFAQVTNGIDVLTPFPDGLLLTNLTGHPQVCVPNGFTKRDGADVPTSLVLTGRLYGESPLLAVAHAYQQATDHHRKRPPMDRVTKPNSEP